MKNTIKILTLCFLAVFSLSACAAPQSELELQVAENKAILKDISITRQEKVEALQNVAVALDDMGKKKAAISYYEQVLAEVESDYLALNNLAVLYERSGDYDKAAEYYMTLRVFNWGNIEVVKDSIHIHVLREDFETAQMVLEDFARHDGETKGGNTRFISEQFEYIGRMKAAAANQ